MPKFSERFTYLRTRSGFTQAEMSDVLTRVCGYKISRAAISMWESGKRMPQRETLEAIADYYNVPLDYLLGREDDPTSSSPGEFPEVTMIGRAAAKMSPEKRRQMLQLIRIAFPEEFGD